MDPGSIPGTPLDRNNNLQIGEILSETVKVLLTGPGWSRSGFGKTGDIVEAAPLGEIGWTHKGVYIENEPGNYWSGVLLGEPEGVTERDLVNHPVHYNSDPSGVECIEITRHRNFNVGNAIKYLWRAGLKDEAGKETVEKQVEDLRKAAFYIEDEIHRLTGGYLND